MPEVHNTLPEHVATLEELQRFVFPTLTDAERLKASQYLRHLDLFPEGQFVVLEEGVAVGMTTTMRSDFDPERHRHTFSEISDGGWLGNHQPDGAWLYGLDMGIHPAYRGRGWSRFLHRARQQLVGHLGLNGQLTIGMMNGYGSVADHMTGVAYYQQWLEGSRTDPTLTPQRKMGL